MIKKEKFNNKMCEVYDTHKWDKYKNGIYDLFLRKQNRKKLDSNSAEDYEHLEEGFLIYNNLDKIKDVMAKDNKKYDMSDDEYYDLVFDIDDKVDKLYSKANNGDKNAQWKLLEYFSYIDFNGYEQFAPYYYDNEDKLLKVDGINVISDTRSAISFIPFKYDFYLDGDILGRNIWDDGDVITNPKIIAICSDKHEIKDINKDMKKKIKKGYKKSKFY